VKVRYGIVILLVGLVLFVAGAGAFSWAVAGVRSALQYSTLQTIVPPHGESIVELEAIGRHEFGLRSESRFDFSLLPGEIQISQYKAGEQFSVGDEARSTTHHNTFIQTGSGSRFALLFANSGDEGIVVSILQTAFENPSDVVAFIGLGSIVFGLVLALVGTVLVIVLLIVRSTRGSDATASRRAADQPLAGNGAQKGTDVIETRGESATDSLPCPSCGSQARPEDRFCTLCGAALEPSNPPKLI
jgi:hypothetical protein